jgi:hypothetical protein
MCRRYRLRPIGGSPLVLFETDSRISGIEGEEGFRVIQKLKEKKILTQEFTQILYQRDGVIVLDDQSD